MGCGASKCQADQLRSPSPSSELASANVAGAQGATPTSEGLGLGVQPELGVPLVTACKKPADKADVPAPTGSQPPAQINSLLEFGSQLESAESTEEDLEELADDRAVLPQALGKRGKRRQAEVASELRKVRRTADAVAHATALRALATPGQTSTHRGFEGEMIGHVVESLIATAARCAKSSELRGRLICVLRCADRLLTAAMTSSGRLAGKLVASWQAKLGALRKVCAQVQVTCGDEQGALGGAVLELSLTRLEIRLAQLPREDAAGNVAAAGANVVVGLCKSFLMMKLDDNLVTGLKQTAGLAADATRKGMTKQCFTELALMDQLAVLTGGLPAKAVCTEAVSEEMMQYLEHLQERHFHRREGGEWEPTPGRWEPKAAFAELLAEVALVALPPAMLWRICVGDEDFIGLSRLMSLGVSATWRCGEPAMLRLTRWAEMLLLPNDFSFSKWQDQGIRILSTELRQVAQEAVAGLGAASSELLSASVKQAAGGGAERLKELSTQLQSPRPRREAQELLARSGAAVDSLRCTLLDAAGAAEAAAPVCGQASKILRALGAFAAAAGTPRAAFNTLRSMLEQRVRMELLGEEGSATVHQIDIRKRVHCQLSQRLRKRSTTLCEWLDQAVRELPVATLPRMDPCDWGELVAVAPGLEAALGDVVNALREVVRAVHSTLEHGAAMLAGFLKLHVTPRVDPNVESDGAAAGRASDRLLLVLGRCAACCELLRAAVAAKEKRWEEELIAACCEAARDGAMCDTDSAATPTRGDMGARLEKIIEKMVSDSLGILLPVVKREVEVAVKGVKQRVEADLKGVEKEVEAEKMQVMAKKVEEELEKEVDNEAEVKGMDGLLHELGVALAEIAQDLDGADAPTTRKSEAAGASELAPLVEPLAVRADLARRMLEDLARHARHCAEALELHVSAPLNSAQEALSDRAPCWGTPPPAKVLVPIEQLGAVEGAQPAAVSGPEALVHTCVRLLHRLQQSLSQEPLAGGAADHLARSLLQMEDAESVAEQGPEGPVYAEAATAMASIGCTFGLCGGLLALADVQPLPNDGAPMDEATERFKKCLKEGPAGAVQHVADATEGLVKDAKDGVASAVQDVTNTMKVEVVALLEAAGASCSGAAAAMQAIGDACGAIAAPMLGLVGDVARSYQAGRPAEVWRVREAAALGVICVLDGLRRRADLPRVAGMADDEGSADPIQRAETMLEESEETERVREALQSKVVRCWSFEPFSAVRAVLAGGDALAAELNASRGVAAEEQGPQEDGEAAQQAAATREDRREAWSTTQDEVKQEVEARLRSLAERQREADQATDVLRKQELLVQCREEHAALAQAARNVHDLGTALGVLVGFLSGMDAKLDGLSQNLDELQAGVRVLGADLKRLVGRPVLEELGEQRDRRRLERCRLREVVYIPAQGVRANEEGKFELNLEPTAEHPKGSNPPVDLLGEVREQFLQSHKVNLLLLSGPAGSGKSTFVEVLEQFLETEYAEERQGEEGTEVCLLKVSLPTLQNPLADLFGEALRQKGLREAQIQELRDLARRGRVRLIFLLDAYDELPSQCLFKNLYMSNNLEQYRAQAPATTSGTAADGDGGSSPEVKSDASKGELRPAYPKVIVTTRTELLSRDAEYERSFVPVEMDTPGKASVSDARKSFLELRIAPFNDQVDPYIHAKVALEVRRELGRKFGDFDPLSKQAADALEKAAIDAWAPSSPGPALGAGEHPREPPQTQALVHAACQTVMASGEGRRSQERIVKYAQQEISSLLTVAAEARDGAQLAWVLAGALRQKPPDLDAALREFCEQLTKADGARKVWLYQDYRQAFDAIPELKELTTTPFMVEIVTEILPKLSEMQGTDAFIKAKLLLLLQEDAAQMVWGAISRWRGRHLGDSDALLQVREALDSETAAEKEGAASPGLAALAELAKEVAELLRAKGMHLKQPKLVEIAGEQVAAKRKAGGSMEHATWSGWTAGWRAAGVLKSRFATMSRDEKTVNVRRAQNSGQNSVAPEDGAVNDAVEEVLDDLLQLTEYEEAVEDTICSAGIPYMLKRALQRPKVRRSDIYAMFTARYVEREARKAIGRGAVDAATVVREGKEYAQRLALTMVSENVSKVPMASSSELFHEESVWDPFLRGGGELRAAAQSAAPVKCDGGMLTYIHKTVQEYLCAASLRAAFRAAMSDLAVPLEQLEERLQSAVEPAAPGSTVGAGAGEGSQASEGTEAGVRSTQVGTRTAAPGAGGLPEAPQQGNEQRKNQSEETRVTKALQQVAERLLKSGWAQVDLRDEDVVRDFLTDLFLDDVGFAAEIGFVVGWSQQLFDGARQVGKDMHRADLLRCNVSALLSGTLPKRSGGTILHAAASDGAYFAVSKILEMLRAGLADGVLLEQRDDEGRTPLFCAAQRGHAQVAAALLAAGAQRDARSKLRPERFGLFGG
ncbi:hypothetical protein CYMTET_26569 [Cymbomonas tetramitiformis]|uniref:AAA+ ATPase domain-containing protein n=1 Tax=Cymbomonas tetramitiformis TaxID=36881 RepID=A0AAE0KXS8_9CHLO|nr:hypothetical protein CYMTET_26569 [Cymbomonas tetramitiformis]